jgi:hypothetical protein
MIKVRKISFKNKEYIDIRKFYLPKGAKPTDDLLPTKKGISIPIAELDTIVSDLIAVQTVLEGANA